VPHRSARRCATPPRSRREAWRRSLVGNREAVGAAGPTEGEGPATRPGHVDQRRPRPSGDHAIDRDIGAVERGMDPEVRSARRRRRPLQRARQPEDLVAVAWDVRCTQRGAEHHAQDRAIDPVNLRRWLVGRREACSRPSRQRGRRDRACAGQLGGRRSAGWACWRSGCRRCRAGARSRERE
jgi:hypothetical protein